MNRHNTVSEKDVVRALPVCLLLIDPAPGFIILDASDAYLEVTHTSRAIIGQPLFSVFPDNPADPQAKGVSTLTASLEKVIRTGKAHRMPALRFDTREERGSFVIRYWSPLNVPVFDREGKLQCIIHTVEDVTEREVLRKQLDDQELDTQQQISDAVSTTQEMERMEISRELHDNINQILITSRLYLGRALQKETVDEQMVQSGLELVEKAIEEIRQLSAALVQRTAEEESLVVSLEQLLQQVLTTGAINVSRHLQLPDESLIVSKVKTTVFRIVQEQLSNVMKHSGARNLFIGMEMKDNDLHLTIRDDGKGFSLDNKVKGMGFQNMKSRLETLNGTLSIQSSPGDGCTINVQIPVSR